MVVMSVLSLRRGLEFFFIFAFSYFFPGHYV